MRSTRTMFLAVAAVCATFSAYAQNERGTILGTVTDPSGAFVGQSTVTVTNVGTGISTSIVTNDEGLYLAPNLIPGEYSVTVERPGFKKFLASGLILLVDQKMRVDAHLQAGDVKTVVEVTSTAQMVNTDSSTVGHVVENKQIVDLPLVNRNFQNLAALNPATVLDIGNKVGSEQGQQSTLFRTAIYIGGARPVSNVYMLDGVDNNDPSFQIPTITPSIDAIQEFKLLNKGYSAEYGGGAAQVNLAIKSGTNDLHGTAYEFLRNDALNATNLFSVPDLTGRRKPQLRYNQFGFSLGGPVVIPHVVNGHNKLFFFANYEGTRIRQYSIAQGNFPTAAELSGNFSGRPVIYDPRTGSPFPENVIPSNRISPKSQQVIGLNLFRAPNLTQPVAGYNTIDLFNRPTDVNQLNLRVDAKLGDRTALYSRYSWSDQYTSQQGFLPLYTSINAVTGYNVGIGVIHTFSPTLVNELRLGYNRPVWSAIGEAAYKEDIAGKLFKGTDPRPANFGAPSFGFAQYSGIGNSGPVSYVTNSYSLVDNLTWVAGRHVLKFGADVRVERYFENYFLRGRGSFSFDGRFTQGPANSIGNAIADFLLGLPSVAAIGQGQTDIHMRGPQYYGFIQDDWKVFPRLTLNLGLRYEYVRPLYEEQNRIAVFDADYPGGRVLTPDQGIVNRLNSPLVGYTPLRGLIYPDRNDFSPRFGFAFRPFANNSTVINGGYGLVYDHWEQNENIFGVFGPPWQNSYTAFGTPSNPIDYANLFPSAQLPAPGTGAVFSRSPHNRTPYSQEWNLTVEHELKKNWLVQIGYQGSASSRLSNRNIITQGILNRDGTVTPGPWYNFSQVLLTTTDVNANYHAGTAMIEKRFSAGYYFQAHYTYSKILGVTTATCGGGTDDCVARQNYWNAKAEYGPAAYDLTHRFVFNGIWELPIGRGRMWAGAVSGIVDKLISGWQVGGFYQAQSGFPFSVLARDASGTSGDQASARADLVGDPKDKSKDPLANDPTLAFNRLAFAQPAAHTFGNLGRNRLRGRGLNNVDFSIIKNTVLRERLKLQFRAELFNAFNHPQFGPRPSVTFNPNPTSSFGLYRSLQVDPRIIQGALKFIF